MSVSVICDGGASLPEGSGVFSIPLQLDTEEKDAGSLQPRERQTTAAPSPGSFLEAIRNANNERGTLVVTIASELSSSSSAARLAVKLAGDEGYAATIVDSRSATVGEGLVALAAKRAAEAGDDLEQVKKAANAVAQRVRLVAEIADLDHLARSGRVPALAVATTRLTGIRPVFELSGGVVRPLRPALNLERAERRIVAELASSELVGHALHLGVLHGAQSGSAERLLRLAGEVARPKTSFVAELSPLMLLHTGPGLSGLAWWWEAPCQAA